MDELWVAQLGEVDYREALDLQERLRGARQAGAIPDTMLLLEHPRVYTRGRRSAPGELSMGVQWYREQGISIVKVNRGGKVTYHGPGQLVGYPIVAVDDVVEYVRTLERALIDVCAETGVGARARVDEGPDYTGVWVGPRKIASIGVHVARGVTTHGFALNVVNDLAPFGWVVACGLPDVTMTSLALETPLAGTSPPADEAVQADDAPQADGTPGAGNDLMACTRKRTAYAVARALGRRQRLVSRARLEHALSAATAVPA